MDNLILLIIALGVVAVFALGIILVQYRHIRDLTKPRYGFLGKPLYSMAVVAFMLGSVGIVFYGSANLPSGGEFVGSEIDANKFFIDYSLSSFDEESYEITLKAVPVVLGTEWGFRDESKVDIDWKLTNRETNETTQFNESGLTVSQQGGITLKLKRGENYLITAKSHFLDRNWSTEIGVNF